MRSWQLQPGNQVMPAKPLSTAREPFSNKADYKTHFFLNKRSNRCTRVENPFKTSTNLTDSVRAPHTLRYLASGTKSL
jgi:hypothetical protein